MNILMIVLRVIHIGGAIFWGGGALIMEFFIGPTIAATAEGGQQFARHLNNKIRIHIFMTIAAASTILAGVALYWIDSQGFSSPWMRSGAGTGFSIGAAFGLIAFAAGATFGSGNARLGQISAQIQAIQKRNKMISPIHVGAMILSMLFMATARYFSF